VAVACSKERVFAHYFQIELKCRGRKTGELREKPWEQGEN